MRRAAVRIRGASALWARLRSEARSAYHCTPRRKLQFHALAFLIYKDQ